MVWLVKMVWLVEVVEVVWEVWVDWVVGDGWGGQGPKFVNVNPDDDGEDEEVKPDQRGW